MAQFRGTVQGGRGEAARLGHKSTGLSTTCRGWSIGVDAYASTTDDVDCIAVVLNEGNGYNAGRSMTLGYALETPAGPVFQPSTALVEQILRAHGVEPLTPATVQVAA
jgi:hypothetical protein